MLLSKDEAYALAYKKFSEILFDEYVKRTICHSLTLAELDNRPSHGFSRIPFYYAQAKSGKINVHASIGMNIADNAVMVSADNGFAFPAICRGLEKAEALLKHNAIVLLTISHSHHCGVLGQYVEQMARKGFVGFAFSNTPKAMAPFGGNAALFGTNPLAFGCPYGEDPLVIDMALSKAARGKILTAKQKKESIPDDWAIDSCGNATTDPEKAMEGALLPIAGAKGTALALLVEIMSASLTASSFSYQASSFFEAEGPYPNIGQSFIFIDPCRFNPHFQTSIQTLCAEILKQKNTRIPGMKRFNCRAEKNRNGITISDDLYRKLL